MKHFQYLRDKGGFKISAPGKTAALVRIVPDEIYAGMWRVRTSAGGLSDMVNLPRAKDIAFSLAEAATDIARAA